RSTKSAWNTATSRTSRGPTSETSPAPPLKWGVRRTRRRRSLGGREQPPCGETKKSNGCGNRNGSRRARRRPLETNTTVSDRRESPSGLLGEQPPTNPPPVPFDPILPQRRHAVVFPAAQLELAAHPGRPFPIAGVDDDRAHGRQGRKEFGDLP